MPQPDNSQLVALHQALDFAEFMWKYCKLKFADGTYSYKDEGVTIQDLWRIYVDLSIDQKYTAAQGERMKSHEYQLMVAHTSIKQAKSLCRKLFDALITLEGCCILEKDKDHYHQFAFQKATEAIEEAWPHLKPSK